MVQKNILLFGLLIITIAFAALAGQAEDTTETPPARLGPAVGVSSTPFAVGYRMSMGGYQSLDIMLHIPAYVSTEDDGYDLSGLEFGALAGYNFPIRVEKDIYLVLRPQLDITYLSQKSGNYDNSSSTLGFYPGAFAGIEVFLEEVGVPNANIAVGFTTGAEILVTTYEIDAGGGEMVEYDRNTFIFPKATSPFGATVSVWWYF